MREAARLTVELADLPTNEEKAALIMRALTIAWEQGFDSAATVAKNALGMTE